MKTTKIKVCGMMESKDIEAVNKYQPDFIGFIIDYPKSHRSKTQEEVKILAKNVDPEIQKVGVFVDAPVEEVIALAKEGTIDLVQLHGTEDDAYITKVQQETGKPVIKAYVIQSPKDIQSAKDSMADLVLLDCGRGRGKTFPWQWIPEDFGRPFFLAGGLQPDNLQNAYEAVHPWGMDISSGVETDGKKDEAKIAEVMNWRAE